MAYYNLWVPSFGIGQIRSNDQDTLVASMGLRVMNAEGALHMDWPAQSVQLGTHVAPDHVDMGTYLLYQGVDVPDPTPESADGGAIYWSFLLVNAGHPDISTLVNALTTAADAVAGAFLGSANIIAEVAGGVILGTDALVRLLTTGCDGVVAAQNWAFTAAQLANMAGGEAVWNSYQNYPGTSSSLQCGAPSEYGVNYNITQGSKPPLPQPSVRVPNLMGQSTKDASSIAHQAGFSMVIMRQTVAEEAEGPTVSSQQPAAGLLFPRFSAIQVGVIVPPKVLP